jgi:hypothetical protein
LSAAISTQKQTNKQTNSAVLIVLLLSAAIGTQKQKTMQGCLFFF